MSDQNSYWVITSRAKGDANSPFGGSATSNQTSQLVQMTEDQIRQEYQDSGQLQDKFGSFDSYMGYINDSQEFVQSAEWMTANPEYRTGSKEWAFLNGEDLAWKPGQREQIQQKIIQDRTAARTSAFEQWMGGEAGSALMEKYGIEPLIYNDDGDKFKWTGSGYQKTYKVDDHLGPADYGKMLIAAGIGAGATPAIAGALGGIGGAALPAGVAGPSAPLLSSGVAKGLAAGATSAASQGLLTGSIDPASVLSSALIAGVNPGGYVADNYAPWAPNGQLQLGGASPSSFYGGLVSGTVNDVVKNGLVNGEFDLQDSLEKGLISGGINSVTNAYEEFQKNSQENLADQLQYNDPYKYPNTEAGRALAMKDALSNPLLNTTDFGALIGDGGLLPFIPRADLTGIRNITDTVGDGLSGLLNGFELDDVMQLPDGTTIPMKGMTDAEYQNYTLNEGGVVVKSKTAGLLNNPIVNGLSEGLGAIFPEKDGDDRTALSDDIQAQVNQYTEEWLASNPTNELNQYGTQDDGITLYNPDGSLTSAGVARKWDFINTKMDTLDSFNFDLSGGLNEDYSWSSNPRGDSELWGTLTNIPGLFSTGSINNNTAIQPPRKENGDVVKPLNLAGGVVIPDEITAVNTGEVVLPSNNDNAIRNQNILDYLELLDGGLNTDSTASTSELEVDTTKNIEELVPLDTTSTVSTTGDALSTDETLSTNNTKTIDTVTTAVVPEVYVDPEAIVAGGTTLSGSGSPPVSLDGNSDKGLPVLWGMLDPYTKFRGYAKNRQDLYSKMMKALDAKDSSGMLSSRSTILTPRERELFEAGEFKR